MFLCTGQFDHEQRTTGWAVFHVDGTSQSLDDCTADAEAQSGACFGLHGLVGWIATVEPVENLFQIFIRNARAGIGHR